MTIRHRIIKVRLNNSEYSDLIHRAFITGLPPAVYLREKITKDKIPNIAAMRERTGLLNRWNANLNMISKWCNVHKSAADGMEVQAALVNLSRLIRRHFMETPGG